VTANESYLGCMDGHFGQLSLVLTSKKELHTHIIVCWVFPCLMRLITEAWFRSPANACSGGADKSLARPGRKTSYSDQTLTFAKPLNKNSEGCSSNHVSAAAMASELDKKWRPFIVFFSRGGLRTYQHPCKICVG
jgi:hypothetical protein